MIANEGHESPGLRDHQYHDGNEMEASIEDLQIAINQLKTGDGETQLGQLQFFADFVHANFLPPAIFIQLQEFIFDVVGSVVNGVTVPDPILDVVFELVSCLGDLFDDQLDYTAMVSILIQTIERGSAFLALSTLLKGQYRAARQFLSALHDLYAAQKVDDVEMLHLIYCCSYHKDLVTDLMPMFDFVMSALADPNRCAAAFSALTKFSKNPIALDAILSTKEIEDALTNCPKSNPKIVKAARNLAISLAEQAPERCLKVIKPVVLDFIKDAINSGDTKSTKSGLALARNVCGCVDGIQLLLESGALQFLFDVQPDTSYATWKLAFVTVCTAICNGPDIVALSFDPARLVENIVSLLSSEANETKLLALTTLQTIAGANVRAGKREINEAIASDDALMDVLSELSQSGDRNVALVSNHVISVFTE